MDQHYEPTNPLSMPFECFEYDSAVNPFPVSEHWHYFAEVIFGVEGNLLVSRGKESAVLRPSEIIFINPLMRHSLSSADGKPVRYNVIKLDLGQIGETPSYAPDLRTLMLEAEQDHRSFHLSVEQTHSTHIDYMFKECLREYRGKEFAYDLKIRAVLYLIFTSLIRLWIQDGFSLQNRTVQSDPLYSITSYIDRHIQESLKVEELARHCGLSYPWFAKRFREIYGISCKEYIEKVRISKVAHYLVFTDYDLNYISQATGYADCSHMIKDFRRLKQTTPGQFRQLHKKEPPRT